MATTQKCPQCGAQTSGKFCSECGAPLAERPCPHCGATLTARARFCPDCGAAAVGGAAPSHRGAAPAARGTDRLPWMIAGVAVLAAIAVIIAVVSRRGPEAAAAAGDPASQPATTDLSQLTPREQADRLYDRVARASEAGDSQQVRFFGPMALQAYTMLDALDADARLHLGLIQIALQNPAAAAAEADTILRGSRTHLYGLLLRARAAELEGNRAVARQSYQSFVASFDAERAKALPEYGQHAAMLDQTRTEAQRILGAAGSRP